MSDKINSIKNTGDCLLKLTGKGFLFLFIIILVSLTITSIHANDSTDIDVTVNDTVSTFADLNDKLSNESDTVVLNESYRFNSTSDVSLMDGVKIKKNLTLVGVENSYIDGNNEARCLYIDSNCNVTLKNLIFRNGFSLNDGAGVLLGINSTLRIYNCTFENNKVYNSNGGALRCMEDTNTEIHDSTFFNNTSIRESDLEWKQYKRGMGSAICVGIGSDIRLFNTILKNNTGYLTTILVVSYDDVNYRMSRLFIRNCTFENNTAFSSGVIYLDEMGWGEILDSVFRNNVVTDTGAAMILDASVSVLIKNCLFDGNSGIKGGAIHIKVFDYSYMSNVSIVDCNFTKNKASVYGGAISSKYGLAKILNCSFLDNIAETYGGAIYAKLSDLDILDSYFNNNSAQYGGAVFFKNETVSVINSTFVENAASIKGGAIFSKIENVTSSQCIYQGNVAPVGVDVYGVFFTSVVKLVPYYGGVELTIKITSPWNMPLSQNVKLRLKGSKSFKTDWLKTDSNGMLKVNVPSKYGVGPYSLTLYLDSGVCYSSPIVNVVKAPVVLKFKKIKTTYGSGKKLKIQAINKITKKPVPKAKLTIKVFTGKRYSTYNVVCDENGRAEFDTSKISAGKHDITITSKDKNIKLSKVKSEIKIKRANAKIISPKSIKRGLKLKITVKNKGSGNPIAKTVFKVKIFTGKHFKSVKVKTNSKGILKIKTKKLTKGKHKIAIKLKDDNYSINKKFKIKVK